jgi:hypothetical protein
MMVQFTLCGDQMEITPEANAGEDTLSSSKEKEATTRIFAAVITRGHSLSAEARIRNARSTSNRCSPWNFVSTRKRQVSIIIMARQSDNQLQRLAKLF